MNMMAAADTSMTPVGIVLEALRAAGKIVKQSRPDQWEAQCPAHDDTHPSMGVNETPTGKVLICCQRGCTPAEIVGAIGLRMRDLFPREAIGPVGRGGLQERARYQYTDEHGELLYTVIRYVDADGRKTFRQQAADGKWSIQGIRRVLYNLPQVERAKAQAGKVYIVEGEKDAENLAWHLGPGAVVTTNVTGAGKWRPEYNEHFRGVDVVIIADDDTPGRGHADQVAIHLSGVARSVEVMLPADGFKDISDQIKGGLGLEHLRPLAGAPAVDDDTDDDEWAPRTTLVQTAAEIRAGTRARLLPDHLHVEGGLPLLYRGKRNMVFGESGGGKSWLELWACLEAARRGERTAIIDYEDSEESIAERLVALGATDDEIALIDYYNPTTGLGAGIEQFEARQTEYAHVWVDSAGEAMAAANVDPNVDPEVARWFVLLGRFTRLPNTPGATVLDHVPKANDAPSAYAIGSQRKRAAITGASYRVETLQEPAKGKSGKLKLIVAKDRGGNRAKGTVAALVDLIASEDGTLRIELRAPSADDGPGVRPADLMQKISEFLAQVPGATAGALKSNITGKDNQIIAARDLLVNEGYITLEKVGQSIQHRLNKPYQKLMDPFLGPSAKEGKP